MTRRRPPSTGTEPLFGEERHEDETQPASATTHQRRPASRQRTAATTETETAQDALFSLDELITPKEGKDEPLRPNGPAALAALAPGQVLDDREPGQLLLGAGEPGIGPDRPASAPTGGRRPAGRGLPGQGRPPRPSTPPGGGDRPDRPGPAAPGTRSPARPGRLADSANFRPRSQDDLAPSGAAARIRANLAALTTLNLLKREERPPTITEQQILARWSGWGAVPEVFDESRPEFAWARDQLSALLTAQERAAAVRNTLNAHYTDAALVQAIWTAATQLGFTGGRVLEPGCGSGNFIGLAPPAARITGIELDPVTAAIASALYPDATIVPASFASFRAPDASFDLAIGNVPFGQVTLHDPRHNRSGHSIHNFFIVKALHLTRPAGLVMVLTSRFTMDSRNPAARREIAALADLAGAIRLPSRAHQRAAGTSVVTDLLILRRREPGRSPDPTPWEQTRPTPIDGAEIPVNEYFLDHPDAILGTLAATSGAYRADDLVVTPTGDTVTSLAAALARTTASARLRDLTCTPTTLTPSTPSLQPGQPSRHPDGYLQAHPDGTFTEVADGQPRPFAVPRTQATELRALLHLRDATTKLLQAEADAEEDLPDLEKLRGQLGQRYDSYVQAYGPLNRFTVRRTGRADPATGEPATARVAPPQGGFRGDPFAPLVYALEEFDAAEQRATKAAIFSARVIAPRAPRFGADTAADALAICLDTHGEPRLPEIARLLGVAEEQARRELGTLVFDNPASGRLVPAAEYLSGNVRDKLRTARRAARGNPRYAVNANELAKVVPADLPPEQIDARLGTAWIDAGYVQQFLCETLDDPSLIVEHPGGQIWGVHGKTGTILASSTWGTGRYPAPQLAQAICEQRRIEVRDTIRTPGGDRSIPNVDETLAAQAKATELADHFSAWAWQDPARATELARTYNERFNNLVLRNYDNADLSLPGLSLAFRPRKHQVAAVARMISEPAVLLAHEVGAGKTAEMIIGVTELRRLGLIRKPAIVVPNHMLEQFSREWLQLYPNSRELHQTGERVAGGVVRGLRQWRVRHVPTRRLTCGACMLSPLDA
jgi:hypothetical protein